MLRTRLSQNSSGWGDPRLTLDIPPFPWIYPYEEDGPRLESVVLRPVVPISVAGTDVSAPSLALVDSGCEHVVAAPWVADAAGLDARQSHKEILLGLGGESLHVRFVDARLRLHPPGIEDDDLFIEWEDEVGLVGHWKPTWPILLGQTAFMKRFTVTMSRHSQAVAIDDAEAFDRRYSKLLAGSGLRRPQR